MSNLSARQFAFPEREGSGVARLVPHASAAAVDLMEQVGRQRC